MNNFQKDLEAEIEIEISQALGACFHDKLNYFICVDPESRTISNQCQKNEYTIFEFNYKEIFGDNELNQDDFFMENGIENWEQFFHGNWDRATLSEICGEAEKHIEYKIKIEVEFEINNMDSWEFEYLDNPITLGLEFLKRYEWEGEGTDTILIAVNQYLKEQNEEIKDKFFSLEETFDYPSDMPKLNLKKDNQKECADWEDNFAKNCMIEFKQNNNLPEILEQYIMTEFRDTDLRVFLQEN